MIVPCGRVFICALHLALFLFVFVNQIPIEVIAHGRWD